MNELEQTLSKILEKALNVAEQTGDFVVEQAPELLQQFYSWHIATSIMTICLFIITLVAFIFTYKKADFDYSESFWDIMTIILGIVNFTTLALAIMAVYKLVFIMVAPKLYLIEYFIK